MLAKQTPLFESAAETLYQLESDPAIRWLCESHQASVATLNYFTRTLAEKDAALAEKDTALAERDTALAEKDAENARLKAQLAALKG